MPHKCIYTHTNEEFKIQSCIQAYKGNTNVYGPLWTPTCICAIWTFFLIILYLFHFLFFPKRLYHSLHNWQLHDRLSPSSQYHVWLHPPYILLFSQHSPVICKDFFPLIYMYKSSRYYAVFYYRFGSYVPSVNNSLSLEIGSTAAFKYFGLYCQWLPGLTTKSTHYYSYLIQYHTRFTLITQRILPLTLSFDIVPLDPLAPKLTMRLSASAQIPTTQRLTHRLYNR